MTLVFVMLFAMAGNVFATESTAQTAISQITVKQDIDEITVQLVIPGGAGSGNGRLIYEFPEELTLTAATSLVGAEGISDLTTNATTVSFAWACYEDFADDTALLELTFQGTEGTYVANITLPEKDNLSVAALLTLAEVEAPYRFTDVMDESAWFFDYVYEAYEMGLMNGVGNDLFDPDGELTRAQMVVLLYRMAGSPAVTGENSFTDVPADSYFADAAIWASENNISNGIGNNLFDPDTSITREAAVTMLVRYLNMQGVTIATGEAAAFTDAGSISSWAVEAVELCAAAGIVGGYPDGTFRPQATITRAQAAKIMVLFCQACEDALNSGEEKPEPTDPVDPVEPETGYTVTFVGEDGYAKVDGQKVESITLEPGVDWVTFHLFGDHSQGYDLDDIQVSSGTLSRNGSAFVLKGITGDVTVSFTTKDLILTVKYVSARNATITPSSQEVAWGTMIQPPVATCEGYQVEGWYTEPTFENRYDFTKPVYESVTLYAKWETQTFTVRFWDDETLLYTMTVNYKARCDRPADPQKEDWLFTGWYTEPELTTAYSFLKAVSSDLDLYAGWRVDDRADYIYLGASTKDPSLTAYGVCGDDANDGSSMEQAVKTFERAKELLADSKNPVIILCGQVTITEDTTWSMADLPGGKIVRNIGFTAGGIVIPEGVTLTLDNIIIDGGGEMFPGLYDGFSNQGMLYLEKGGNLVLNEGVEIQNCINGSTCAAIYASGNNSIIINEGVKMHDNESSMSACLIASAGSDVIINGGEFYNNRQTSSNATYDGYASCITVGSSSTASLTINGGYFHDNHATVGATVAGIQSCSFTMNGGTITNNTSDGLCGGIRVGCSNNSTSYTGQGTLYLKGGTVSDNTSGEDYGNSQICASRYGQIVFQGVKDAVDVSTIYICDDTSAYGLYLEKPLSNMKGGSVNITYSDIDINTILLRGYNTYKITEADTYAYKLTNSLDPYYKAELDTENSQYKVVSNQNIGFAVYVQKSTIKTNPGDDANDGLTPETPVATFDRAKEILAANAASEGQNIIYIMGTITVAEGEEVTLSLEGIPNAVLMRHETNTSNLFSVVGGTLVVENITIDGNAPYMGRTKASSALFIAQKNGSITIKSGTVVQNILASTYAIMQLSVIKGYTCTGIVEDITVTGVDCYSTSSTAYYGASLFCVNGAGPGYLTINGGTFTDNEARLVYTTGVAAHEININDCNFSNNYIPYAGAIFCTYNSANGCAGVINFNGGTFENNRATAASSTLGVGGIGYHMSDVTVNFNGGTFSGNTAGYGAEYNGVVLKPYKNNIISTISLNSFDQEMSVYLYDYTKAYDTTCIIITAPLVQKVNVACKYQTEGFVVAKGTDTYTLTEADLAMLNCTTEGIELYLDAENNQIRITIPATEE